MSRTSQTFIVKAPSSRSLQKAGSELRWIPNE